MKKGEAKQKGDLLEDLVAILYDLSPGKVKVREHVPCLDDPSQKREVDVLVIPTVTGYPAPIVIECKNEKNQVGIERIDAFFGKLDDIGVHPTRGIFVCPCGYTSGAERRAQKAGIQLLVFKGLTPDRMEKALNKALLSVVHYLLFVKSVDIFPYLPQSADGEPWALDREITEEEIYNEIWKRWISGDYDAEIGASRLYFRGSPGGAVVENFIRAYVGEMEGQSSNIALQKTDCGKTVRAQLMAEFKVPSSVELKKFESQSELVECQKRGSISSKPFVAKIRVPRIVAGSVFWPPSSEAMARVQELINEGKPVTFATVEGNDLAQAWVSFGGA